MAAPFCREWHEKPAVRIPARRRYSWILLMKYSFVNGNPKEWENVGEFRGAEYCDMRLQMAETGHKGDVEGAR